MKTCSAHLHLCKHHPDASCWTLNYSKNKKVFPKLLHAEKGWVLKLQTAQPKPPAEWKTFYFPFNQFGSKNEKSIDASFRTGKVFQIREKIEWERWRERETEKEKIERERKALKLYFYVFCVGDGKKSLSFSFELFVERTDGKFKFFPSFLSHKILSFWKKSFVNINEANFGLCIRLPLEKTNWRISTLTVLFESFSLHLFFSLSFSRVCIIFDYSFHSEVKVNSSDEQVLEMRKARENFIKKY